MTDLEKVNQFTQREHRPDEIFTFEITLCNNDIDRDSECFTDDALFEMKKMFIGKTGIFDIEGDSRQTISLARIYDTEVECVPNKYTRDGHPYLQLNAKGYMVRTSTNANLIKDIDGGLRWEGSISCSARHKRCSICGCDLQEYQCSHRPGVKYNGRRCYRLLSGITDAYEWSLVQPPLVATSTRNAEVASDTPESITVGALRRRLAEFDDNLNVVLIANTDMMGGIQCQLDLDFLDKDGNTLFIAADEISRRRYSSGKAD